MQCEAKLCFSLDKVAGGGASIEEEDANVCQLSPKLWLLCALHAQTGGPTQPKLLQDGCEGRLSIYHAVQPSPLPAP
jgi:hypothetical protein